MINNQDDKVFNDITDDLCIKLRASYLILMQCCSELSVIPADSPLAPPRELAARALRPENISEGYCASLWQCRAELIEGIRSLMAVQLYQILTRDYVLQCLFLKHAAEIPVTDGDAINLFAQHIDQLTAFNKSGGSKDAQREINTDDLPQFIASLPLRITAARYYDYVRDALTADEHPLGFIGLENLKRMFYPLPYYKENSGLSWIKESLDFYWENNPQFKDMAALEADLNKIENMETELKTLTRHINLLLDAADAAYLVSKYGETYGAPWVRGDIMELCETCQDLMAGRLGPEPPSAFTQELEKTLDITMESITVDSLPDTLINYNENGELPEARHTLLADWDAVETLFYETGVDFIVAESTDPDNDSEPAEQLIAYMERVTQGLPAAVKRYLRQHFIIHLPYPYDFNEYRRYFFDTYDSLDEAGKSLMAQLVNLRRDEAVS